MRVLIVDDEELIRRSLGRAFQSKGHEVHFAEDGKAGVKQWTALNPDLVCLDVLMPFLTGPQVMEQMAGQGHEAKVLLMSAYTGEGSAELYAKYEIELFIPKPFENIFDIVERAERIMLGHGSD